MYLLEEEGPKCAVREVLCLVHLTQQLGWVTLKKVQGSHLVSLYKKGHVRPMLVFEVKLIADQLPCMELKNLLYKFVKCFYFFHVSC